MINRMGLSKRKSLQISEKLVPYVFISPFVISFLVFFIIPSLYSLFLSFCSYKGFGKARFVGVHNYISLFKYSTFWEAVGNTLFYFVYHFIPVMIISFLLAVALNSPLLHRMQKIYKPLIFLSQLVAAVAAALVWRIIFSTQYGVINELLGTRIPFLEDVGIMKWSVVILIVWKSIGWYVVIYLAGLTTINGEIDDATRIDGASLIQRLLYVTIPIMKPIFLFAFLMDSIDSFKIFSEPNVLISGNTIAPPTVAPIMNILTANINGGNFGMASAVGWLLFLMIFIISMLQYRLFKERRDV
jgi:ABC-type sugar transport system permease subunit